MSAQVLTLTTSLRPAHRRASIASVTVLADHKRAEVRVTCDPIAWSRAWLEFWAGAKR